jgi:cysteine desulfurase family protein
VYQLDRIYLDNGATSFPKAPGVGESMANYINMVGSSTNRGAYDSAYEAENIVFETRELVADLFGDENPENVVFTKNITEAMNLILKGLLENGDEVVVSSVEHNAVMRPLRRLEADEDVKIKICKCDNEGNLDLEYLEEIMSENIKAVIMTHASNVSGTILPLKEVGEICKKYGVYFIVDCAQTAGLLNIDRKELNASAIAFTGHKSLLGPQGIGGCLLDKGFAEIVKPFIEGGTGSFSEEEIQPSYMPDKFESGTPNIPGIYGLNVALKYINERGIENMYEHEMKLMDVFLKELIKINEIKVIGRSDLKNRMAVCSVDFFNQDNGEIAYLLSKEYGISTRCGLHCAPSAHKTLNTFPNGTVRFSIGHANTLEEIEKAIEAIKTLSSQ